MNMQTRSGALAASDVRHAYLEAAAAHGHDSAEALVAWWQWRELMRRERPRSANVRY